MVQPLLRLSTFSLTAIVGLLTFANTACQSLPENTGSKGTSEYSNDLQCKEMQAPQDMTGLVVKEGYPLEEHFVATPDGYILGLYRIPHGRIPSTVELETMDVAFEEKAMETGKPVVLLQHGLLDCSASWVCNGANESLGFILADRGFDVWLANSRGNTYSLRHRTLNPCEDAFWQFTFDEMAYVDLPAVMRHILDVTNVETIGFVGHSQGTTIGFGAFSQDVDMAHRVSVAAMLAPVAFLTHTGSSVLRWLAGLDIASALEILGIREFLPSSNPKIIEELCKASGSPCRNIVTLLCGYNAANINNTRWPTYLSISPAGTSVANMIHWTQCIQNHNASVLQEYDFGGNCHKGRLCNEDVYGMATPPAYNISELRVPVAIFSGGKDILADQSDVQLLLDILPDDLVLLHHEEPSYAHLDFTWGMNAHTLVYPKVVQVLEQHARKNSGVVGAEI
ncbi:unnamed protein product [Ostreobium quekettii]|uniref:Partial AB-hydrolase lipase domain-containing protein n=1 Tax=Ostreobium quekettii TaxID=121088 RepID=A0A8S1J135_9CHLO|nr:unnamed protein product [Ostreobium quekettii]|eukprot:evm.model.scf_550.6 EVM.evm.TU.scf_550.6   scf_550:63903-65258(+)